MVSVNAPLGAPVESPYGEWGLQLGFGGRLDVVGPPLSLGDHGMALYVFPSTPKTL